MQEVDCHDRGAIIGERIKAWMGWRFCVDGMDS